MRGPYWGYVVYTDIGVTGEYMSIAPGTFEQIQQFGSFLIGKSALQRELFYNQAKVDSQEAGQDGNRAD